ncbi:MAG TPA: alternative ribosome rescue aminoacyl-tRNA hydrolase ArfB [Gemmataceae bacterium]|nr:alternative ribosome rescue aminoacyl-tRNA hydrolase ArfB [Gemmataceae bacterium]
MLEVDHLIQIPESEFQWRFVRAGGPGGQNVNKVASKAVLRWNVGGSPSLPAEVKMRLRAQQRRRITSAGELVLNSQRFRDQERNRQDCLEKLCQLIRQAAAVPKPRKRTKPTRSARAARLRTKRRRQAIKMGRKRPAEE